MKQLILILSLTIAAFVAACSDGKTRTPIKMNAGAKKTLADMQKSSSEEELLKLKKQIESDKNAQVPDVIIAVKRKFGNIASGKDQPKNKDKKEKIFEKDQAEEQETEKMKSPSDNFEGIEMTENLDDKKVVTKVAGDTETKFVCIITCDVQIIVKNIKNDKGQLVSVKAYVAAEIKKDSMELGDVSKSKKSFESLQASYDASTDSMNLQLLMIKEAKKYILNIDNYIYGSAIPELKFSASKVGEGSGVFGDHGSLEVKKLKNIKVLILKFEVEESSAIITLKNDLGIFGKNSVVENIKNSEVLEKSE